MRGEWAFGRPIAPKCNMATATGRPNAVRRLPAARRHRIPRALEPLDERAPSSLAVGQTGEFLVWASMIAGSGGQLHVFLPLLDRGLDAVVHRLDDGSYRGIQVKMRTSERWHEMHVVVRAEALYDDSALLIAGRLAGGALGPSLFAVPVGVFKERALFVPELGGRYEAWFSEAAPPDGRWAEFVVPAPLLASRLTGGSSTGELSSEAVAAGPGHDRTDGST